MDKILHDPKDPKLWELWCIPYYGSGRILSINRSDPSFGMLRNPCAGAAKDKFAKETLELDPSRSDAASVMSYTCYMGVSDNKWPEL